MKCSRFEEWIALDVGDDLPRDDREALARHLAACTGCRALRAELEANREALRGLAEEPVNQVALADVRRRVLSRIESRERFSLPRWAYAFTAVFVVLAAGWFATRRPPVEPLGGASPLVHEGAPASAMAVRPKASAPRHRPVVAQKKRPRGTEVTQPHAPATTPLLVKFVTDDPNVVIYWLIDKQGD